MDLRVWDKTTFYNHFAAGVKIAEPELEVVAEFAGAKIVADPNLEPGICEFRDDKGALLLRFKIAEE